LQRLVNKNMAKIILPYWEKPKKITKRGIEEISEDIYIKNLAKSEQEMNVGLYNYNDFKKNLIK